MASGLCSQRAATGRLCPGNNPPLWCRTVARPPEQWPFSGTETAPVPGNVAALRRAKYDTVLRQLAAGWRVRDHEHADELEAPQGSEVKRAQLTPVRVLPLRRWRRRRRAPRRRSSGVFRPRQSCRTATGRTWRRRFWYEPDQAWPDVSTSCLWRRPCAAFLFSRAASSVTVTTGDAVT